MVRRQVGGRERLLVYGEEGFSLAERVRPKKSWLRQSLSFLDFIQCFKDDFNNSFEDSR